MSGMDHEQRNRAQKAAHWANTHSKYYISTRKLRWRKICFGKYRNLCLAEAMFEDPGYFYWLRTHVELYGDLALQSTFIADRVAAIKSHWRTGDSQQFVIERDKIGRLKNIRITDRSIKLKLIGNHRICPTLDLRIVTDSEKHARADSKFMSDWLKQQYFGVVDARLCRQDCIDFLLVEANFDLTAC